jgi:hypothetical protein
MGEQVVRPFLPSVSGGKEEVKDDQNGRRGPPGREVSEEEERSVVYVGVGDTQVKVRFKPRGQSGGSVSIGI